MRRVGASLAGVCAICLCAPPGCQWRTRNQPPPDARRPEIKSEAELAAERAERIRLGQVVPTTSPTLAAERVVTASRRRPIAAPMPGAIQGDILLINDSVLTVAQVIYPLRDSLAELRRTRTYPGFLEEARRLIRRQTQQEVGSLLIYKEACLALDENEQKAVDAAVDKQLENLTAREYGGSSARLTAHLREYSLTREQFREDLKRALVVRQYTREKLQPQIQIRRDELLGFYRSNLPRYSTPEARELLLIEVPFEKCLSEGKTWDQAGPADRAQAKLKAVRRIRAAQAALEERPFEEVAREYSLGLHADSGGSWGLIGRPLQPPYDGVSRLIFEHEQGWTSEPIESELGWYIVRCGRVQSASQRSFVEVQEGIRLELMEQRFNRLSAEYMLRLAEKATISSLDAFINTAVQQADKLTATANP